MSKEAYNIRREVGEGASEVGILERDSGEESGDKLLAKRARLCPGNEGTVAVSPATEILRALSPSLCTVAVDCSSRMETPVSRNRFEDPRNQPTTDWLDKVKEKRRNKDGGTAVSCRGRQEVGRIKAPRIVLPPETKDVPFSPPCFGCDFES